MRFIFGLIGFVLAGIGAADSAELPEDFAEMRSAICDSKPTGNGCAKCPAYMDARMPDALEFNSYLAGSFTAPDSDEVLLRSRSSCYSHADGFSSAVLLRKMSGKWERIAFYHNEMELTGDCRKIPGQAHQKDLLLCEFFDWGNGSVAVIGLNGKGEIASRQKLISEWLIPWRESQPEVCSIQKASFNKISSDEIDLFIQTQTFVRSSDYCHDEYGNHEFEEFIAEFIRSDGRFEPTAATRDFLKRHNKRPE